MQRKKKVSDDSVMKDKIEYLGLNFKKVPKTLIATENLNFKVFKGNDEKQYKQYKFIKISDIDILLTPTHRMDSLSERYEKASPLYMYLDATQEENATKYATFLKMLKKVEISEVNNIEKEQQMLAEKIPFKVKFNGNYLWQIYYSESTDKYFMLVPTEDSDYSTFFYLLKKKIENKKNDMVFVPISQADYSGKMLKKSEIKDIDNYLWLLTKDYPSIYEVSDKEQNESLQVVGEANVYGKIKTLYKMVFNNTREANKFYKLLKAVFILQVELPHYYNFNVNIDTNGNIEIYLDGQKVKYEELPEFVATQYKNSIELKRENEREITSLNRKLSTLKRESLKLEKEYLEKEKIISTFLECKKSFFGKVKYFFTMGKKTKNIVAKRDRKSLEIEEDNKEKTSDEKINLEKRNYTLDELILSYKELEIAENNKKNIVQDINALKLKNKNLKKKIENATAYINEINKHKKSIFEFWKYSNKDEVAALEEGEEEEINVSKIEKSFNFDEDFQVFGEKVDKNQRIKFSDAELEGAYIASTDLLPVLNDIYMKRTVRLSDYLEKLKETKDENVNGKEETEQFDVFGSDTRENNKERSLGNKVHRESNRDKYQILEITKDSKVKDFRQSLSEAIKNIKKSLKKNELDEEIYVYKASMDKLSFEGLQKFSLNEKREVSEFLSNNQKNDKLYLYKIKLPKGTNFIAFSNIILYNNKNMTLPLGMQESDEILLDVTEMKLEQVSERNINIQYLENEKNDFSDLILKTIDVCEME